MRPVDLLLYLLLLGAVVLFNVLRRWLSSRRGEPSEQAPEQATDQPAPPHSPPSAEEFWGRAPPGRRERAFEELPQVDSAAVVDRWGKRRQPSHYETARDAAAALSGSKRGQRQGMVALAVLGPCRALAPYDEPGRSP